MKKCLTPVLFFLFLSQTAFTQSRGELIFSQFIDSKSTAELQILLNSSVEGVPPFFVNFLLPTNYAVDVYQLVYYTPDIDGVLVPASGAVFVPSGLTCSLPLVEYLHGTLTADNTVPSTLGALESVIGYAFATDGYVAALPDYLGLGPVSPGFHPYLHEETEASSSIDMLRATRNFCQQNAISLNEQVFLTGYSQGGHAVLATQREIEKKFNAEFNIEIVASGSGPYDLSNTQRNFVFNDPTYANPSFLPYAILSYQEVYGNLFNNLSEVFVPPFNTTIPSLFDGSNDVNTIDSQLPEEWKTMFQPSYLNAIQQNFFHPARIALFRNNLHRWKPRHQLRLYYCTGDELVDFRNSLVAWWNFFIRGAGSKVRTFPVGDFNHRDCAPIVLIIAKLQFDSRKASCQNNSATTAKNKLVDKDMYGLASFVHEDQEPDMVALLKDAGLHGLAKALLDKENNRPEFQSLTLYPNPVKDKSAIDLSFIGEEVLHINIYDPAGRIVQQLYPLENEKVIELYTGDLKAGVYIVEVTADKTYRIKMIKN